MIVAVEGPSAAGKTTWCRAAARRFVGEHRPTGTEPRDPPAAAAAHWVEVDSGRWGEALDLETEIGLALCDTDPVKLHYSWCLAAVGAAPFARFRSEAARTRAAFAAGRLGMADVVVLLAPDATTLQARKAADDSRTRRSFELHVTLREPLLAWYSTVERCTPARVVHDPPPTTDALPRALRADRCDPALLDAVLAHLPPV